LKTSCACMATAISARSFSDEQHGELALLCGCVDA
jgi:hypothetical protein